MSGWTQRNWLPGTRTTAWDSVGGNENRRATREGLTMSRLLIHVEGQTEEAFVNEVLRGTLAGPRLSQRYSPNRRQCSSAAEARGYPPMAVLVKRDIVNHLKETRLHARRWWTYYGPSTTLGWRLAGEANAAGLEVAEKAAL